MPTGHTKFAPDWCFGLLKRKFRRTGVSCLEDMVSVVESSTIKPINRAQLVGQEDGKQFVTIYDWRGFFEKWCKPLKGIKALHHFEFQASQPGTVHCRQALESPVQEFQLFADVQKAEEIKMDGLMPDILPPPGLPLEQRRYLAQNIRKFCRGEVQDVVCPLVD